MLIKISEYIRPTRSLSKRFKGVVVDNADPKKLGRVKCTIEGFLTGDTANLPWMSPDKEAFLGGSNAASKFSVPNMGSELVITFPFDDIYSPFYRGAWESAMTHHPLFDADYPNTWGMADEAGNEFTVNKTLGETKFKHQNGHEVTFDTDVNIKSAGKLDLTTDTELTIAGKTKTTVGDSAGQTLVNGIQVKLAGGGVGVARIGSSAMGTGNLGIPVVSTIVDGSTKVTVGG
jgi:hypothetical protein